MAHKIELRLAPVRETLDARLAANEAGRYGFAFVDADKSGDDAYYERCPQLLRQGGLVAIDNTLWGGSVARPATPTPGRCSGSKPSRTATSASTCPCCPSATAGRWRASADERRTNADGARPSASADAPSSVHPEHREAGQHQRRGLGLRHGRDRQDVAPDLATGEQGVVDVDVRQPGLDARDVGGADVREPDRESVV